MPEGGAVGADSRAGGRQCHMWGQDRAGNSVPALMCGQAEDSRKRVAPTGLRGPRRVPLQVLGLPNNRTGGRAR